MSESLAAQEAPEQYPLPSNRTVLARLLAFAVDMAVLLFLLCATAWVFGTTAAALAPTVHYEEMLVPAVAIATMLVFASMPLYFTVWQATIQTTPGKGLLRLRALARTGNDCAFPQTVLRALALFVDLLFGGLVGVLCMFLTPRKQRVGDLLARTIVVESGPITPIVFVRGLLFLVAFLAITVAILYYPAEVVGQIFAGLLRALR